MVRQFIENRGVQPPGARSIPERQVRQSIYRRVLLRTVIEGYRDLDTAGIRAVGYFLTGRNFYFAAGLAEEMHLDCDRNVYSSCTEIYPELSFAVIF